MKLFKKMRKGFTLIELVVVIAVIAILSAVAIASYLSVTNRAKQSNDQQKVDQVNLSLTALEISGKPKTAHEAVKAVEDDGFKPENFKAEAKNYTFAYSMENNRIVILENKSKVVYPKAYTSISAPSADLWLFDDKCGIFNDSFSHYLRGTNLSDPITCNAGLDVGENDKISSVTYLTENIQNVVFRTNGGTLNIGSSAKPAPGKITHYGTLDNSVIYTYNNSFHTHGAIGKMTIGTGKAVAEKGGIVYLVEAIDNSSTAESELVVEAKENGGVFVIPQDISTDKVSPTIAEDIGYTVANNAINYNSAVVSSEKAFEVGDLAELESFRDLVNGGFNFKGLTIRLTADIQLNDGWIPIGEGSRDVDLNGYVGSYSNDDDRIGSSFSGIFDGNNFTISNLNSNGYQPSLFSIEGKASDGTDYEVFVYGFFGILSNDAVIRNLKLSNVNIDFSQNIERPNSTTTLKYASADSVGAVAGYGLGAQISNVSVLDGSVSGKDCIGGIVGRIKGGNIDLIDCINRANVSAEQGAAGIVGRLYGVPTEDIVIANCKNFGTIASTGSSGNTFAGGILGFVHNNNDWNNLVAYMSGNYNEGTVTLACTSVSAVKSPIATLSTATLGKPTFIMLDQRVKNTFKEAGETVEFTSESLTHGNGNQLSCSSLFDTYTSAE